MKIKLGTSFAVFIIFFAMALFEAIQAQNLAFAAIFILLGLFSLYADNVKKK